MVIVGRSKGSLKAARSEAEPAPSDGTDGFQMRPRSQNAALANLTLPIWTIKEIFVVRLQYCSRALTLVLIVTHSLPAAVERGLSFALPGDRTTSVSWRAVLCNNVILQGEALLDGACGAASVACASTESW